MISNKLYCLRNFETKTFSTHTLFYATSLEIARNLASKFYKEVYFLFLEDNRLEEINNNYKISEREKRKKRSIEILEEMAILRKKISDIDLKDNNLEKLYNLYSSKMADLNKEKLNCESWYIPDMKEVVSFREKNYSKLEPLEAFQLYKTEEETLNYWFENYLVIINMDTLEVDSYVDGD